MRFIERKEFLAVKYSPKLFLVLAKLTEVKRGCQSFIKFEIWDGNNILLWFDCWHSVGRLYEKYEHRVIF